MSLRTILIHIPSPSINLLLRREHTVSRIPSDAFRTARFSMSTYVRTVHRSSAHRNKIRRSITIIITFIIITKVYYYHIWPPPREIEKTPLSESSHRWRATNNVPVHFLLVCFLATSNFCSPDCGHSTCFFFSVTQIWSTCFSTLGTLFVNLFLSISFLKFIGDTWDRKYELKKKKKENKNLYLQYSCETLQLNCNPRFVYNFFL